MAKRDELLIIRAARAGQASAQLTLGKRYLFGGDGLSRNLPTALYWLDRAARQDEPDAWLLIGRHVPYETVQQSKQPAQLLDWYERAFDAGVAQAGLVLARLVLSQPAGAVSEPMREKASRALHTAAHAGIADAQWLLVQTIRHEDGTLAAWPQAVQGAPATDNQAMLDWALRAARSGVAEAQAALADHAWASGDRAGFLQWALPLVRQRMQEDAALPDVHDIWLALRSAQLLMEATHVDTAEVARLLEYGAQAGNRDAQYALGLWLARMDKTGARRDALPGVANDKKAIRWLSLAGAQGLPDAWHALWHIHQKPEFSQRDLAEAQRYLDMAARAGHGPAQYELGLLVWRTRREQVDNDVRAADWLQKAVTQGVEAAAVLLASVAQPAVPAPWAHTVLQQLPRERSQAMALFAARLELASLFGLSRTEALLIDPRRADRGHCLAIDIRPQHPHSKRRLILLQSAHERRTLDRILSVFEGVDAGPNGPEGSYRQRAYRLKMLEANSGAAGAGEE